LDLEMSKSVVHTRAAGAKTQHRGCVPNWPRRPLSDGPRKLSRSRCCLGRLDGCSPSLASPFRIFAGCDASIVPSRRQCTVVTSGRKKLETFSCAAFADRHHSRPRDAFVVVASTVCRRIGLHAGERVLECSSPTAVGVPPFRPSVCSFAIRDCNCPAWPGAGRNDVKSAKCAAPSAPPLRRAGCCLDCGGDQQPADVPSLTAHRGFGTRAGAVPNRE
jgi:hypothetical protein